MPCKKNVFTLLLPLLALLLFGGCTTSKPNADIQALYQQTAMSHEYRRNPVILIPGMLGSQLRNLDTGKVTWGSEITHNADGSIPAGLQALSLPMQEGAPFSELRDNHEAFAALDSVVLSRLFTIVQLKAYRNILMTLGAGGYRDESLGKKGTIDYGDEHFTCFQFPYDWRRSCAENAANLDAFIKEKQAYVQNEYKVRYGIEESEPIKFDIVAHSMGGLILRYYLRYGTQPLPADGSLPHLNWAGAESVEKAIMIGSPHLGSLIALDQINSGFHTIPYFARFHYPPAALCTMPSIFELLPRAEQGTLLDKYAGHQPMDFFDTENWVNNEWGSLAPKQDKYLKWLLPDVETPEERNRIAKDHLDKCLKNAKQFHASLDRPAERPEGLHIELFVGDSVATPTVFEWNKKQKKIKPLDYAPGDGTVSRYSALADTSWRKGGTAYPIQSSIPYNKVTFIFDSHLGLTSNAIFTDNMLFTLLKQEN